MIECKDKVSNSIKKKPDSKSLIFALKKFMEMFDH